MIVFIFFFHLQGVNINACAIQRVHAVMRALYCVQRIHMHAPHAILYACESLARIMCLQMMRATACFWNITRTRTHIRTHIG